MTHSIDDNKWMHFFAGKESALLELLNNFTNKLSDFYLELLKNKSLSILILWNSIKMPLTSKKSSNSKEMLPF